MDGEPFARLQGGSASKGMERGGDAAPKAGGEGRGQAFRQAGQVVGMRDRDVFGIGTAVTEAGDALAATGGGLSRATLGAVAAGQDEGGDDAVALAPFRQRPGLDDLAAVFMSRDVAGLHLRMLADPTVPVASADAAGQGLQDYAISFADRVGDGFQAERFAVGTKDGGAHHDLR